MSILNLIGIADAYADAAANPNTQQSLLSFLPMLLIFVVFTYMIIIRPQSKRSKEHRSLVSNLHVGDEVQTIGGILGKIEKISDDFIVLSIADNVSIMVRKNAIANTLPKDTIKSATK
jgi:preprotein translocase subunit YajC